MASLSSPSQLVVDVPDGTEMRATACSHVLRRPLREVRAGPADPAPRAVTCHAGEHPGPVSEPTGAEVRATAADAARQARGVLAALGDPDDELTATAATRNRIEGAAVALETVARGDPVMPPTG